MSKLKTIRERNNLSQSQLAEATGISFRTIQHYEQGSMKIDNANIKVLAQLSIALGCGIRDIIEDDELVKMLTMMGGL